jgi:hypothetical protein
METKPESITPHFTLRVLPSSGNMRGLLPQDYEFQIPSKPEEVNKKRTKYNSVECCSNFQKMELKVLFDYFDVHKILGLFASLLLERRIVIVSDTMNKITAFAFAAFALLNPFKWQVGQTPLISHFG